MQPVLDRPSFVGSNVTDKVKDALQKEVRRIRVSESLYVFELLRKDLRRKGYDVEEE